MTEGSVTVDGIPWRISPRPRVSNFPLPVPLLFRYLRFEYRMAYPHVLIAEPRGDGVVS